jgi:hypothetical protein
MREWRNERRRAKGVVWERREWFRESMRARERRKEMNVRGAIRSYRLVNIILEIVLGIEKDILERLRSPSVLREREGSGCL